MKKVKCSKCLKYVYVDNKGEFYEIQLLGGLIRDKHKYYCKGLG